MVINKQLMVLLLICSSTFLFSQVRVSSNFDSGSIGSLRVIDSAWVKRSANDSILTISLEIESRFDPLNPIDTALKPSARWYHFRLEEVKERQLFINIKNSEVIRPVYSYDGVNYQRFSGNENRFKGSLSFIPERDTLYIAHFFPYTHSRHLAKIKEWSNSPWVKMSDLGYSSTGEAIEMLTITDEGFSDRDKKRVWIHGRAHPSEAPANWHLEAMVEELLSESLFARELRKNTIFYITPMINPDGVKGGFSRSSSTGVNLEINWDRPDSLTMPEVSTLKRTLSNLTAEAPLDLLLNMHSQISSSVTYWIHTAESTSKEQFQKEMLLSALTINYSPFYRSVDQSFSNVAPRYVEGWMWNRFRENSIAITFETPYTYYNQDPYGPWVSTNNLAELAHSSLLAVSDLLDLDKDGRVLSDSPINGKRAKGWELIQNPDYLYFGNTFYSSVKKEASLKYKFNLKRGNYSVYKWIVGEASKEYPTDTNCWQKISTHKQKRDGAFYYKVKASKNGDIYNAILMVRE